MAVNGLDADGYIEIRGALDKIPPLFLPALNESIFALKDAFREKLYSIYVYGSVATGEARPEQSDIDILVILEQPVSDMEQAGIKHISERLSTSYKTLMREIGIEVTSLEEALAEKNLSGLGCFIQHLCVCVDGEDIRSRLPTFRPSVQVARGFNGDYAVVMRAKLDKLEDAKQPETVRALIRQMCRKTLRTGFSLVMPRLNCWTTDLRSSFDYFCSYYPEQRRSMELILGWAQSPLQDHEKFLPVIKPFAKWLSLEFDRVIGA